MEEYRKVSGYNGRYLVSESGNVFTMKRRKMLCAHRDAAGYLRVRLSMNKIVRSFSVARLVGDAFVAGRSDENCTINHIDGDKLNNHRDNLEWCSQSYNNLHAILTGARICARGEDHPRSRWSEDDIRKMRAMYDSGGYTQNDIAVAFGCRQSQVSKIVRGDAWGHVI